MNWNRLLWTPIAFVSAGCAIALVATLAGRQMSVATIITLCGLAVALVSVLFMKREPSSEAAELEALASSIDQREQALREKQQALETATAQVQDELQSQADRVEQREKSLSDRFVAFQEWHEFPQPEDLAAVASSELLESRDGGKLSQKDQQVIDLLDEEAKIVYERILNNHYSGESGVDWDRIGEDIRQLVLKVAKIYQPDSANPLLETSIEQLARSAGRVFLHTLVILEQLPVDVKSYNINTTYNYIRAGVTSYGAYQAAAPYLTGLSRTFYVGRFIASANPITFGASMLASELGRQGIKKLSNELVNRQAVALLHDIVRVIAFEVASIYGGDFRYRDPNWIYAAEVTALVSQFPISRESIRGALKEIGTLQFRNEYDRVYLYRCIADHRAAQKRLGDPAVLTREQRLDLIARLEKFFARNIHGTTQRSISKWQKDVERRFDVKLKIDALVNQEDAAAASTSAAQSLAAFAKHVLCVDTQDREPLMQSTQTIAALSPVERIAVLESFEAEGPSQFQPPDVDPSDGVIDDYLSDLVAMATQHAAGDLNVEQLVISTGVYFRRDPDTIQKMLGEHHAALVEAMLPADVSKGAINGVSARAIRVALREGETPTLAFDGVTLEDFLGSMKSDAKLLLVGAKSQTDNSQRLALLQITESEPLEIWTTSLHEESGKAKAFRRRGIMLDDCVLQGGIWADGNTLASAKIVVGGSLIGGGYARYFAPLLKACINKGNE